MYFRIRNANSKCHTSTLQLFCSVSYLHLDFANSDRPMFRLVSAEHHDNTAPSQSNSEGKKTVDYVGLHSKKDVCDSPGHADPNKGTDCEKVFHLSDQTSNEIFLGLERVVDSSCCVERGNNKAAEEKQDADTHD